MRKPKNGLIKSAYCSTAGDSSVGIGREEAVVKAPGEFLMDLNVIAEEDWASTIDTFRHDLAVAFQILWGETVTVTFDFEIQEEEYHG